jgi:PadR family transcriptional regulator, regulatory protein PadR
MFLSACVIVCLDHWRRVVESARRGTVALVLFRDLELGAIRTHILHHASRAPVYGSWMLAELERHGFSLSYGTLYPALHKMEQEGLLVREDRVEGGKVRKYYSATEKGVQELGRVKGMVRELYREVVEGDGPDPG